MLQNDIKYLYIHKIINTIFYQVKYQAFSSLKIAIFLAVSAILLFWFI